MLSREKLTEMYAALVRLRRLEEETVRLSEQGEIPGFLHSYLGQEAVAVGVAFSLRPQDPVLGTHRSRGHFLARGLDMKRLMAEVLGKRDGFCRGKGGEMHLADREGGAVASSGIVGGILPVAVGVAFAAKYKGEDRVAVCFFGDGAVNQGTFHESLNLASVWKLPLLLVCENNGWALSTPQPASSSITSVASRAAAYNVAGTTVDGDDVLAVYEAAGKALEHVRSGNGPFLLECLTHRWLGHFVGDPQRYRSKEEIEECRRHDPVARFRSYLLSQGILTPEQVEEIERRVEREVAEAVEFARSSPPPEPGELYRNVYGEQT